MGGLHGISIFNGREWKKYGPEAGPLGSRIFDIRLCPTTGDIWIAADTGVARYSSTLDKWSYFTKADGLPSNQIQSLAFDHLGNYYAGCQADGIGIGSAKEGYHSWRRVRGAEMMLSSPGGNGLPSNLINVVLAAQAGTICAGTSGGLARSEDGGANWRYLRGADWQARVEGLSRGAKPVPTDTKGNLLLEDMTTSLAEDSHGQLFIGHWHGLEVVEEATGRRVYPAFGVQSLRQYVTSIFPLEDGTALVGTYGAGLLQVKLEQVAGVTHSAMAGLILPKLRSASFPSPAPPPVPAELAAMLKKSQALSSSLLQAAF